MITLLADTVRDDAAIRKALTVIADRNNPDAANLRESFRFTLADHARDGGCFRHYQGECPAGHAARMLLELLP